MQKVVSAKNEVHEDPEAVLDYIINQAKSDNEQIDEAKIKASGGHMYILLDYHHFLDGFPATERKLAFADCAQIPLHKGIETPADVRKIKDIKTMKVDFEVVAEKLQEIQQYLNEWVRY